MSLNVVSQCHSDLVMCMVKKEIKGDPKKKANFFTFLFNPTQFLEDVEDSSRTVDALSGRDPVSVRPVGEENDGGSPRRELVQESEEFATTVPDAPEPKGSIESPEAPADLTVSESQKETADKAPPSSTPSVFKESGSPPPTSVRLRASDTVEMPGSIFADRYEILSSIGRGATSSVYKARQLKLDRAVALKVMHPHLLVDENIQKRFEQEAKATSSLSHINLVLIHDFGICPQGRPFLVMDYVAGPSLEEILIKHERLELNQFIEIFSQCCRGLAHAHRKGLVHRDIKPSNVRITEDEHGNIVVKILDFGIAKSFMRTNQSQQLTEVGSVLGSPLFMSPEQCKAEALDPRTDIYSLGVAMYCAISGNYPFVGKEAFETLFKHIYEPVPTFESLELNFQISSELEALIRKTLEKNPTQRHSSMDELEEDLKQLKEVKAKSKNRESASSVTLEEERQDRERSQPVATAASEPVASVEEQKDFSTGIDEQIAIVAQTTEEAPTESSDGEISEQLDFDPDGFKKYLANFTYYELLQVDREDSIEGIHKNYLRRMRALLSPDNNQLEDWQLKELVRQINIAHQILTSSKLRALYESALTKGMTADITEEALQIGTLIDVTQLMQMFKLFGPKTNSILADLKAENPNASERDLASLLTERNLLSEGQLESLVLARYLLATGKITIAQLELVMDEIVETRSALWVGLVAKGWVKMGDLM
jgi:serine/threonine protein kinase